MDNPVRPIIPDGGQAGRQADRQASRQAGRQTGRQGGKEGVWLKVGLGSILGWSWVCLGLVRGWSGVVVGLGSLSAVRGPGLVRGRGQRLAQGWV
jgi:hypothetical protein